MYPPHLHPLTHPLNQTMTFNLLFPSTELLPHKRLYFSDKYHPPPPRASHTSYPTISSPRDQARLNPEINTIQNFNQTEEPAEALKGFKTKGMCCQQSRVSGSGDEWKAGGQWDGNGRPTSHQIRPVPPLGRMLSLRTIHFTYPATQRTCRRADFLILSCPQT